jgi:diphthine-ammonia ligase
MYGAHPAGEGGEYETLTLDTPLFSHRINLTQSEVVITDPEPCLVAYLRIAKAELQAKEGWTQPTVSELREILGLDTDEEDKQGLDEQSCELFEELADAKVVAEDDSATEQPVTVPDKQVQFGRNGRWFSVSAQGEHRDGKSVGGELTDLFDAVKSRSKVLENT